GIALRIEVAADAGIDPVADVIGAVDIIAAVILVIEVDPAKIAGGTRRVGISLELREPGAIVAGSNAVLVVIADNRGGAQAELVGHGGVQLVGVNIGLVGRAGVERGDVLVPGVVVHGDREKAPGRRHNLDLGGDDDGAGLDLHGGVRRAERAREQQGEHAVFATLAIHDHRDGVGELGGAGGIDVGLAVGHGSIIIATIGEPETDVAVR